MIITRLILLSILVIGHSAWAENDKPRNATAPYYCNGLHLKSVQPSIDNQQQRYQFAGICSVRRQEAAGGVYQRTWLEIDASWDSSNNLATETTEITAGGSGKIVIKLKCDNDPWVTNAKCVIQHITNDTSLKQFENRFKVRKVEAGKTVLAGYPPLARHVTNTDQVAHWLKRHPAAQLQARQAAPKFKLSTSKPEQVAKQQSTEKQPQSTEVKTIPLPSEKEASRETHRKIKHKLSLKPKRKAPKKPKTPQVIQTLKRFEHPSYKGHRIAWCLRWGTHCGKTAADAWCRYQKFDHAKTYKIAYNLGKTLVLGDNRLCLHTTCAGFESIVCETKDAHIAKLKAHH